jgi:hypothetical protein
LDRYGNRIKKLKSRCETDRQTETMEAAKKNCTQQQSSSTEMRLDRLISSNDIMMILAGHMDARALFRLGKVSKRLQKCIEDGSHIHSSILHTFPGIKNLPQWKNDRYYTKALSNYYRRTIPLSREFDFYKEIGRIITSFPDSGHRPDDFEFELEYCVLCLCRPHLSTNALGRGIMIRQIQGWKNEIKLHPVTPLRDNQIETILDNVSSLVISNFCFREVRRKDNYSFTVIGIEVYPTNEELH